MNLSVLGAVGISIESFSMKTLNSLGILMMLLRG